MADNQLMTLCTVTLLWVNMADNQLMTLRTVTLLWANHNCPTSKSLLQRIKNPPNGLAIDTKTPPPPPNTHTTTHPQTHTRPPYTIFFVFAL